MSSLVGYLIIHIFHLYLEMYSKCMCRQVNDAWKICFPFCFLQTLTVRHYTQSILLLKLLITEKKKKACVFTYYSFYYLIQFVLWILICMCIRKTFYQSPHWKYRHSCARKKGEVYFQHSVFLTTLASYCAAQLIFCWLYFKF